MTMKEVSMVCTQENSYGYKKHLVGDSFFVRACDAGIVEAMGWAIRSDIVDNNIAEYEANKNAYQTKDEPTKKRRGRRKKYETRDMTQ